MQQSIHEGFAVTPGKCPNFVLFDGTHGGCVGAGDQEVGEGGPNKRGGVFNASALLGMEPGFDTFNFPSPRVLFSECVRHGQYLTDLIVRQIAVHYKKPSASIFCPGSDLISRFFA
jgi:hypothetical protein